MMRFNKKRSEYRLFAVIVLLVGLVFPTFFSHAQDKAKLEGEETNVFTYTGKDGVMHELRYSSDEVITAVVNKEGVQNVAKYNPKEGDIIVQLEDNPIIKYVKKGESLSPEFLTTITNRLQASHQQLKQDIADIEKRIGLPPGETSTTIKREYYYVFNGLALSTDRKVIKELKALPYVLDVYPGVEVKACLTESVPLINADDVWGMGYTGAGITVGIIDTGIDYTHPDLGGGFGPGYKVIGGYDFVNNDNDPMDDHFHGTHVAGIAAANGTLKGVAPDANLVAYKVLDEWGGGWDSDIIAAIERACDPDQDPQTDDALDVINLSLGGQGDPDDPVCQAIDNASGAGVICVCAAGNDGYNKFSTILSPGCAREAITVGATNKYSLMASFSSKGPSNKIYAIKPDLVAPGEAIYSTIPPDSYGYLSGTSMAAPHVAGAAALLRQLYPNYSPQDIKSILMGSAIDLEEGVFVQGTGMLDVYGAAWLKTIVSPASISLGWDDPGQPVFSKVETLHITNTGPIQRTYSLSITPPMAPGGGYPQPGITAEISPANFTLAPGETRDLTFTITVDNSQVPNGTEEPGSYEGKVVIQTPAKTIKVPFAFIKIPRLEIVFDEGPWIVLIHNRLNRG
jgi:minor extracellular serine protease Vpr